jgi:hypothetical protein
VIAVEGGSDLSLLLNPEMTIDSAGQWKVLHRRRSSISFRIAGLMPPEGLEHYLNSVATDAPSRAMDYEKTPASEDRKLDVAASATGWSEPVPGRELHPPQSSAFPGAPLCQLQVMLHLQRA